MKQRLPVRNSFWNQFVFWLLKEKAVSYELFNGNNLEYQTENGIHYIPFEGRPIQGPKYGFINRLIWTFFKNELDGEIGDNIWNPERKDTWKIRLQWWLRNPCHNLTWHVIGFSQYDTMRFDFQKEDQAGWNYALSYVPENKSIYPFCLYQGKVWTFYLGWRGRGTFGIKFNK